MNEKTAEAVAEINTSIRALENMCYITRDSLLQNQAISKLSEMHKDVVSLKTEAISNDDNNLANLFLGFECVLQSLSAELAMYILLKQQKPDEAWDTMVVALSSANAAISAHGGFGHLGVHTDRLEQIAELIFPRQVFLSAGLVVKTQLCSICNAEYGECEHLAGLPYMGKFCCIVARDFEGDHVAIVEEPADKRCRVVEFTKDGRTTNRMTWVSREADEKDQPDNSPHAFYASGPIMISSDRE